MVVLSVSLAQHIRKQTNISHLIYFIGISRHQGIFIIIMNHESVYSVHYPPYILITYLIPKPPKILTLTRVASQTTKNGMGYYFVAWFTWFTSLSLFACLLFFLLCFRKQSQNKVNFLFSKINKCIRFPQHRENLSTVQGYCRYFM